MIKSLLRLWYMAGFVPGAFLGVCLCFFGASVSAGAATLPLEECRLESSASRGAANARCGWYEVAENRDDKQSAHIKIHVAVVPALRRQPLPDPLFIISGGPGQAATDFYLGSASAFELIRRSRDLVIVDQRGTGESQRLDCALPDELETQRFDADLIKQYTRECLSKLKGDPRFYSTSVAVRDLDEIRAALGYEKVNLYGISYGTRVAQHYLRRYAAHVRSVVLDGVVPVDAALGPEVAPIAQQALSAILDRCLSATECAHAFPSIKEELVELQRSLREHTERITIPDPRTAATRNLDFGYMHLATALRLHSYNDGTASLLPFLIHEAAQGHPQTLAAQALLVSRDLNEQVANGMHNAVVCTEDVPFFSAAALADPKIAESYLGRVFVETLQAMCSVWPRGVIDDDFHAPLIRDTPALLLSGENDPITPASYGARAVAGYKNGEHLVVPGQGHGQLNSACIARIVTRFIEAGANSHLDTTCVAKQVATPFMLNANGPAP